MPAHISGVPADIITLNRAFYDVSPSYVVYTNMVAAANSSGVLPIALGLGTAYSTWTEAKLSTQLLGNLGLLPNADLQTALTDYLVSVGKANVGIVVLQLGAILSGLENATGDLAIYRAAAARWNLEVATSHAYSSNPANQSPSDGEGGGGTGATVSLTSGDDTVTGTDKNDTFLAPTPGMLGSSDVVNGAGEGFRGDALKAVLGVGESVAPTLQSIEHVFITAGDGSRFSVDRSTGIEQLWREAAAGSTAFTGVNLATTVGIQNSLSGGALTIDFAGASGAFDSGKIVLADATGDDAIIANAVESLTIISKAGTVASTTTNQARITANAAQEIVIGGEQGLTTTVTGARIGTIDASGLSGALNLGFATTGTGAVGIMGGGAGDTLTINDASGARLIIASGDGGDTVSIGASNAHIVTLGGGADTLQIGGLAGAAARDLDTSTAEALGWSAIRVIDFESGVDTLRLTAASTTVKAALGEAQLASISASASLLDATALAATTAGAHKAVAFRYGADTYILVNNAAAALGANDSLIKLSGVAALADASWAVA